MKFAAIGVVSVILFGSGCWNIGGKVALIADYETVSGDSGGAYRLTAAGGNSRELLAAAIARYQAANPPSAYDDFVPVEITWDRSAPDTSWDVYEGLSQVLTFFSLGIWPTIMSDRIDGTLKFRNAALDLTIPVRMKKRYMYGWLSILPVPGWAVWRGDGNDLAEGEVEVIRNVIEDNLCIADHRKYLITRIVGGKDTALDPQVKKQDTVLRTYALRHAPEKWREIQRIRTETAIARRDIARYYADLKALGYDPYRKKEFARVCGRYFRLRSAHRDAMSELEKLYSVEEYGRGKKSVGNSGGDVTLEEILKSME